MPASAARSCFPCAGARLRLRLGHRLAAGLSRAQAARAEGVTQKEVDLLLADPDFAQLVAACRANRDLPDEERLARLERLAFDLLELAINDGDIRAILFFLHERKAARNPGRTLAESVLRTDCAASRPRPAPRPKPARGPAVRPYDPGAALLARARARLRPALRAEVALRYDELPAAVGFAPTSARAIRPSPTVSASARPVRTTKHPSPTAPPVGQHRRSRSPPAATGPPHST
jgi:hypothetical protein